MNRYGVIHGDCVAEMAKMADGSVTAVITDPPYNAINRTAGLRQYDKGLADSAPIDIDVLAAEFVRLASGTIYVFCSDEQFTVWTMAFKSHGLSTRICAWTKSNPAPIHGELMWLSAIELCVFARKSKATFNEFCASPVWHGPSETREVPWHPTPKPEWLMRRLVRASTNEGDTVLDPFSGSGTTGVACGLEHRNFVGIEMQDGYVAKSRQRISDAYSQSDLFAGVAK